MLSQFVVVQRVGNLDQDAGAVAHQLVGAHGAAVIQVFQDLQALLDDGVALAALDMGHEADATGVVLVVRVIQALGAGRPIRLASMGVAATGRQESEDLV